MIKIENLSKIYDAGQENEVVALDHVSLELQDGTFLGITGRSGCGKSTLLRIMAGIDRADEGRYEVNDTLVNKLSDRALARFRNEKIGFVMQDFGLIEAFTALENVRMPLDFTCKKSEKGSKFAKESRAIHALLQVGMGDLADRKVSTLSGGQKQRVAIARAIVNRPDLILADEPTGALDRVSAAQVMQLFHMLNRRGKTIIMVTHDLQLARECSEISFMEDGRIQ